MKPFLILLKPLTMRKETEMLSANQHYHLTAKCNKSSPCKAVQGKVKLPQHLARWFLKPHELFVFSRCIQKFDSSLYTSGHTLKNSQLFQVLCNFSTMDFKSSKFGTFFGKCYSTHSSCFEYHNVVAFQVSGRNTGLFLSAHIQLSYSLKRVKLY